MVSMPFVFCSMALVLAVVSLTPTPDAAGRWIRRWAHGFLYYNCRLECLWPFASG